MLKKLSLLDTNHKRKIITTVRTVVGIGLAIVLIHTTLEFTGGDPWRAVIMAKTPLLLLALVFQGVIACIASYRWNLLLRVQGVCLHVTDTIRLTLIGLFFGLTLLGSVSGDLVKMSLVKQHTKDNKAEAILTVMLDRILGLFGLFIVASFVVLFSLPFLLELRQEYRPIQIAAFTVGLGSIGCALFVTLVVLRQRLLRFVWVDRIVNYSAEKLPVSLVSILKRLVEALDLYRQNQWTILAAISLSIIVHSFFAFNLFIIGASVGENVLGLRDYFLASQVANVAAALPLTPGGIGTRDAVIALFFNAMQAPSDKVGVVPVVLTLLILVWGLIGGIFFVFSKKAKAVVENDDDFSPYRLT
jgi:uncharacterized protein (TIRG00374 family)